MLPEPTTTLTLPDGRVLACDDTGDRDGVPVVWLHGAPDCRLARHPDDGIAARAAVRLVAVDRPGYGWSDPPAPSPLTFGDELGLLLDALEIETAAVAAWSAGAPWAWAAAAALGERVSRVVTYGAVAPLEALGDPAVAAASGHRAAMAAAVIAGEATAEEIAGELAMLLVPTPPVPLEQARDQVLEGLTPADRAAVEGVPGLVDALASSLAAAVDRHADAGLRADLAVQLGAGMVDVATRVACPAVLVHGEHDPVAGPAVGEWLAGAFPRASVEVWPGAGHQAVVVEWARFLGVVTGAR